MDLIQYIGSIGGITGVLAFLMFLIYRSDRKSSEASLTELVKSATKEQAELVRAYNDTCKQHTEAMVKNTQVQTELVVWLKAKNGHG
jgi:hypothetical protein